MKKDSLFNFGFGYFSEPSKQVNYCHKHIHSTSSAGARATIEPVLVSKISKNCTLLQLITFNEKGC
jgi:hypothetical protein